MVSEPFHPRLEVVASDWVGISDPRKIPSRWRSVTADRPSSVSGYGGAPAYRPSSLSGYGGAPVVRPSSLSEQDYPRQQMVWSDWCGWYVPSKPPKFLPALAADRPYSSSASARRPWPSRSIASSSSSLSGYGGGPYQQEMGVIGLGSSACKIPSRFQSESALEPHLPRQIPDSSDLQRRRGPAELALAVSGPDRREVKVPHSTPGKIPNPSSDLRKMKEWVVSYEEDASDPTAIWRVMSATNYKADVGRRQLGKLEMARRVDDMRLINVRSTPEGNYNNPLTGFSVVVTGGEQDPKDFGIPSWLFEDTDEGNFGIPSWLFGFSLPDAVEHAKDALSVMDKNVDSNEVGEVQREESALKGSGAKTKSNDPIEAPSQPVDTNDKAEAKKGVNESGDEDKINKDIAVKTNFVRANVPDEAKFYLTQLHMVGRDDIWLWSTGLLWKPPPWPDFCAMGCDSVAQHGGYEVLVNFHSVKRYHISLDKAFELNDYCRSLQPPISLIKAEVCSLFGSVFCDFRPEITVLDVDGEDPHTGITASISNDSPALVSCDDEEADFHMKQDAFLYNLGAQMLPKSYHCFSRRLMLEYSKFSSLDSDEPFACKLNNPKHRDTYKQVNVHVLNYEAILWEKLPKFSMQQLYFVGLPWNLPPWPDLSFCEVNWMANGMEKGAGTEAKKDAYNAVTGQSKIYSQQAKSKPFIEDTIKNAIEDSTTWPVRKVIPISPGDYNELELKLVGTLEVKLVQARDLANKDVIGKSDPFAILYAHPLLDTTKRSKTINNDLNPIWNEHSEFTVEDVDTQSVTVKIYDVDGIQESELIGCVQVGPKDLQTGKVKDVWLKLVQDLEIQRDMKNRGQAHLELLYCPINMKEDGFPSDQRYFSRERLDVDSPNSSANGLRLKSSSPLHGSSLKVGRRPAILARKEPQALLEYSVNSSELGLSSHGILMSGQNKGFPVSMTKVKVFKLPAEQATLVAGKIYTNCVVDAALFLGRSFRVGWGPNGILVHSGSLVNSPRTGLSSVFYIEKIACDKVVHDEKHKVKEELAELCFSDPMDPHRRLDREILKTVSDSFKLKLQKFVASHLGLPDICRSYIDTIERQLEVSDLSMSSRVLLMHQVTVWELIRVLFSERAAGNQLEPTSDEDQEGMILDKKEGSDNIDLEALPLVSESQFTQVLNIELDQIIEACKFLDENWSPKFTLIVAQKNHRTKFFLPSSPDNVFPGSMFAIFFFLNALIWRQRSSGADPIVNFCETVVDTFSMKCLIETHMQRNKITMTAELLEKGLAEDIENDLVSFDSRQKKDTDFFWQRYLGDVFAARSVWAFGFDKQGLNILLDDILSVVVGKNLPNAVKDSMFQWVNCLRKMLPGRMLTSFKHLRTSLLLRRGQCQKQQNV